MKAITKIQTVDGKLHDNEREALRHAEAVYTNAVHKLVGRMLNSAPTCKALNFADFIDENLNLFIALSPLKNDLKLEADDNDEE